MNVDPDFAVDIIKACIALHRFTACFVCDRDRYLPEDTTTITETENCQESPQHEADNVRNILSKYFLTTIEANE